MKKYCLILLLSIPTFTELLAQWPKTITLGTGTTSNTSTGNPTPYANYNRDYRAIYLVRASEIQAAAGTAPGQPCVIQSLAFNVRTAQGATLNAFTIRLKQTTAATLTTTPDNTGLTTVFGPVDYSEAAGWNTHTLSAPFCWNGTSNLLVEVCVTNPSASPWTNNAQVYNYQPFTNTAADRMSYHDYQNNGNSLCGSTSIPSVYSSRPHLRFVLGDGTRPDVKAVSSSSPGLGMVVNNSYFPNLTFGNIGCFPVTSVSLGYQWNNDPPVIESWTGSLAPGANTLYTFTTPLTASPTGYNTLKLWVNNPNGIKPDGNVNNDTLIQSAIFVTNTNGVTSGYTGADFWLAFMQNYDNGVSQPLTQSIYITSVDNANVTVSVPLAIPGTVWSTSVSVPANTVATVVIPNVVNSVTMATAIPDVVSKTGIHVVSNNGVPVTVYAMSRQQYTTDGFLVIPTVSLGKDYIVVAPVGSAGPTSHSPAEFIIVSTVNGTTATIKLPAGVAAVGHAAGSTWTTPVLSQGQTYLVQSQKSGVSTTYDLTGAIVTSNNPVAVIGGTTCATIGGCSYCDHVNESVTPTISLGKTFYIGNFAQKTGGDIIRVISSYTGTTNFTFTGYPAQTLTGKGAYRDFNITGGVAIISDQPLSVVQMCKGGTCDAPSTTTDPFILNIIPQEQWGNFYSYTTPPTGFANNYVNIVKRSASARIAVDGIFIPNSSFTQITGTNYYFIKHPISSGDHITTGDSTFMAYVYGFDKDDSYGYPASGAAIEPIAVPVELLAFTGKYIEKEVKLNWLTASEKNSSHFTIERSGNGTEFTAIGQVKSSGNSRSESKYAYTDSKPLEGVSYYRLRQTDLNGQSVISGVISVTASVRARVTGISPVPFKDRVKLTFDSYSSGSIELSIHDAIGQEVHRQVLPDIKEGGNETDLELSHLTSGIYILIMDVAGQKTQTKIIKQ